MDYDRTAIPEVYAQARRLPPDALAVWRDAIREMLPPRGAIRCVIDLGCGTGRFTPLLADVYRAAVVGVDPSSRMLAQRDASAEEAAHSVLAHAEALPLRTAAADLVFLSMVYHHLEASLAVAEISRVLRPSGHVILRNPTRETVDGYEYLQFFPEARALDVARMPARDDLLSTFAARGFDCAGHRIVMHPYAASYSEYVTKVSRRGLSSLAAISDEAFARGLAAFERHCRDAQDHPIYEPVEIFLFRR